MLSMASSTPVCWMTNLTFHPTRKIDITLILYIWKITTSTCPMVGRMMGRTWDEGHRLTSERSSFSWWPGGDEAQKGSEAAGTEPKCWKEDKMSLEGRKLWKRITDRMWPRVGREQAAQIHQDWVELAWTQRPSVSHFVSIAHKPYWTLKDTAWS